MVKQDYLEFQLEKIQAGSIPYLWDRALRSVLENILDENTEAKTKRKIRIDAVFTPSADRTSATVAIFVGTKLVQTMPVPATVIFGMQRGRLVAKDQQTTLWEDDEQKQPELVPVAPQRAGGED